MESPIIRMSMSDKIVLSFDLLDGIGESLRYRIFHCNKEWIKDLLEPNEFIYGFEEGSIDNFKNSFSTLREYTHYHQTIPSEYSTFIASGNYILEVFLQDDPDSILFSRRFWVTEESASIIAKTGKPSGAFGNIYNDQELSISINFSDATIATGLEKYIQIQAQQNKRIDLIRTIPFHGYNGNALIYNFHSENVFPGGNCFRYFDISNIRTPMYNVQRIDTYGGEIFAFLQPDEIRTKIVFSFTKTLNGGCKINIWDRKDPQIEADYVWVNFSLPMQTPYMDGNIYIIGDLTQWQMNEDSRMEWQPQYKAYTKRMLLKQGYYAYQLIFLPHNGLEGESWKIEGDHYETPNDYYIYAFMHTPADRYDRLIAAKRIIAN